MDSIEFPNIKFPLCGTILLVVYIIFLCLSSAMVCYSITTPIKAEKYNNFISINVPTDKSIEEMIINHEYSNLYLKNSTSGDIKHISVISMTNTESSIKHIIVTLSDESVPEPHIADFDALIIQNSLWDYIWSNLFSSYNS